MNPGTRAALNGDFPQEAEARNSEEQFTAETTESESTAESSLWPKRVRRAARQGRPLSEILEPLASFFRRKLETAEAPWVAQRRLADDQLKALVEEFQVARAEEKTLRDDLQRSDWDLLEKEATLAKLHGEYKSASLRIGQSHLGRLASRITTDDLSVAEERLSSDLRAGERQIQQERDQEFERKTKEYEANREEFERRAQMNDAEALRVETQLRLVDNELETLLQSGWTEATGRFSVWGGLAGVLVSSYISLRLLFPRIAESSPGWVAGLRRLMGPVDRLTDLWSPLLHYSGLLLAVAALFIAVAMGVRGLLRANSIKPVAKAAKALPNTPATQPFLLLLLHVLFPFLPESLAGDRGRMLRLTSDVLRLIPLMLFAALLLFFGAALDLGGIAAQIHMSYLSLALTFAALAVSILFVAPRYADAASLANRLRLLGRLRQVPVLAFALFTATLIGCALLPRTLIFNQLVLAAAALSLMAGGIGGAAGSLVLSIYGQQRQLRAERDLFRAYADNYRNKPILGEEPYLDAIELSMARNRYYMRGYFVNQLAWLENIRQVFSPTFADEKGAKNFLQFAARVCDCVIPRARRQSADASALVDGCYLPDETTEAYIALVERQTTLLHEIQIANRRRGRCAADLRDAGRRVRALQARRDALEGQINRLEIGRQLHIASLRTQEEKLRALCEDVYFEELKEEPKQKEHMHAAAS
jgi:hypothetical protein